MTTSTEEQPPKIEFPCADYPIKIIGDASDDFRDRMVEIIRQYAPEFDEETVVVKDSRNGRFLSVQVRILATSVEQLQRIHEALKATGRVHMVL